MTFSFIEINTSNLVNYRSEFSTVFEEKSSRHYAVLALSPTRILAETPAGAIPVLREAI
jgi:hypothetical protein